jgi:hypothetical protein
MSKNVVEPKILQTTMIYGTCTLHARCARICTRPRSPPPPPETQKYVIFIAFSRQQLFRESALRYMLIACLFNLLRLSGR